SNSGISGNISIFSSSTDVCPGPRATAAMSFTKRHAPILLSTTTIPKRGSCIDGREINDR
ncbi:MAG TPA: hypothetical protein VKJ65_07725, partial [Phycisphaerae bacterium]|nr:hypothetical protein [Phycisphaerae bacterium]